eukprot:TRINITY_DN56726_c0_g1_i1.p1 TRINITY_DN56726_c0_g1~~TRINITY_DN56726_c0_g1_i1.p1  ORF type:complete len:507 (+),score=76.25 TRINITY_DN56726_c0_g1_i1:122-1522(+)
MDKRIKELTRKLRATATFHAIDAPHVLPYDQTLRGWWSYPSDLWDGRAETIQALADGLLKCPDFEPLGFQQSFEFVLSEWSKGDYDGVLGFSQGAILAAALCSELHKRSGRVPRFAVLISGFGKPVPRGVEAYPPLSPLPLPSLHIWGLADDHIPAWASESLAAYFEKPEIYTHAGHHFVPQKAADVAVIQQFLTPFAPQNGNVKVDTAAPKKDNASASHASKSVPENGKSSRTSAVESPKPTKNAKLNEASPAFINDELGLAFKKYCHASSRVGNPSEPSTAKCVSQSGGTVPFVDEELQGPGPGTYERLSALLKKESVSFKELGPHEPCRTSEDAVRVRLAAGWDNVSLNAGAKAMLLRAGSAEEKWLLAVLPADRKLSWKKVRVLHGKSTRMATEEEVGRIAGCIPGAVPPFAAAFPASVECMADPSMPAVINFNCGLRSRSMQLSRADYERVQRPSFVDIVE